MTPIAQAVTTFRTVDDHTICPVRLFGTLFAMVTSAAFVAMALWTVIELRQPLDYIGYGGALATIWSAFGLTVAGKRMTEVANLATDSRADK